MAENQTDEALEYLSHVETSTEKLMLEADLYQQINMLEVAIDKLIEARDLEPNDPIIHFALQKYCIMTVSICARHMSTKQC